MKALSVLGAALIALGASATVSMGQQNPLYEWPSPVTADELARWNSFYLGTLDGAPENPDAVTFTFTDHRLNSPMFSPMSAAVRTVSVALTGGVANTCLVAADLAAGSGAQYSMAVQVRSYMLEGRIATDMVADPVGSENHAAAIEAAQIAGWPVRVVIEGDTLVSYGLPPAWQHAGQTGGGIRVGLTDADAEWIVPLFAIAPDLAAAHDHQSAARLPFLGNGTFAQAFKRSVDAWLVEAGHSMEVTTHVAEVWFGTYGSVPMLVVGSDTSFVLIDGTTGALDGPFSPGTTIDPTELLAMHASYVEGSPVSIVDEDLCLMQAAKRWRQRPPPGWTPTPPVPGGPPPWTDYNCQNNVGGRCKCTSTSTGTIPGPPPVTVPTKIVCWCSPGPNGNCNPAPGSNPGAPPPITPPGGLGGGCSCTQFWYY